MFSSHRYLSPERKKNELNPIKGTTITSLNTGNLFKIVDIIYNHKIEVCAYKFQSAKGKDAVVHEMELNLFWETFTTKL